MDTQGRGWADSNILLRVAEDRTNATALSIPRDLIADVPDRPTKQPDGSIKTIPGTDNIRFNTSIGRLGRDPGRTVRTVEQLTGGIEVDHFMMADFNAVKTLTTAVGGVEVRLDHAVHDKESHLQLPAGPSKIEGEKTPAFVRTRYSRGNHGDLDGIKVQQQFLSSLFRKVKSDSTLSDTSKLLDLAEAATKAVIENEAPAQQVFAVIKGDASLTEVKKKAKEAAKLKGPRSAAADVRVGVYNAGAPDGSARTTLAWPQNQHGVPKIVLTLAEDFKGAGVPPTTRTKAPAGVPQSTANEVTCAS